MEKYSDPFMFRFGVTAAIGMEFFKVLPYLAQVGEKPLVFSEFFVPFLRNVRQENHRIPIRLFPQIGVDAAEKIQGVFLPAPPQIQRQILKEGECLGDIGKNLKRLKIYHVFDFLTSKIPSISV
jgi:hypothetical protein